MAKRRTKPHQPKSFAAKAAIVLSAAFFGVPASAATDNPIPCPASETATLTVAADELLADTVSHDVSIAATDSKIVNSASLLAPRAEAAIRDAFDDNDAVEGPTSDVPFINTTVTAPLRSPDTDDEDDEAMITRLPGITDDELSRFRKQMFRRDI